MTQDNQPILMRLRTLVRIGQMIIVFGSWFLIAGRVTWPQGWGLCLSYLVLVVIMSLRLARTAPELLKERIQPAKDVEPWDKTLIRIYMFFVVVLLILAALDSGRYGWSKVPVGFQGAGWTLAMVAGAVISHVLSKNAYASSYARLQGDRGQTVVRDGLYGWIRHPMYLGVILLFLALPLLLASLWSFIPSAIIVGLFVYRTYREDRMLRAGLEGYTEYTESVRYRLLPRIW